MSGQYTPHEFAGRLYVYKDEDRNAIAVAKWRVGPNGGLTADSIARMSVPSKHIGFAEINRLAAQFAAAPDLLEALEAVLDKYGPQHGPVAKKARAAIAKAKGGDA